MVNENLNLKSGHSILTEWAKYTKFNNKLDDEEEKSLILYNRCLSQLSDSMRKVLQAKYLHLARFYISRDANIKWTDSATKKYNITRADDMKISNYLGLDKNEVRELAEQGLVLVAKQYREEMLKEHKIVKELVEKEFITDKSLIVDTVNKFKLKYDNVTFTTSYITKSKRLLKIRYYQTVWKPRGVEEHEKSDNAL